MHTSDFLLSLIKPGLIPKVVSADKTLECFPLRDDWFVFVSYTKGKLDGIEHFLSPHGEVIDFKTWPPGPNRDRLIEWCG